MKFKSISKLLIAGLLLNTINLNCFASILSEDNRYETFIENDITVPNVLEDGKTSVKIEGNTLVNLAGNITDWNGHGNATFKKDFNSLTISNPNAYSKFFKVFNLKANTTYTFFVECKNTSNDISESYFRHGDNAIISGAEFIGQTKPNSISLHKKSFTTNNTGIATIGLEMNAGSGSVTYYNIVLVEGDYSSKDINYFEEIQSSFDNTLVTQEMVDSGQEKTENLGKYRVDIKSTGRNKFNENMDVSIYNKDWTKVSNGFVINTQNNYTSDWFHLYLKPNTQYTLSADTNAWIRLYYGHVSGHGNGEYHIGSVRGDLPSTVFTTDNTGRITLRLTNELKLGESYIKNIQLEEGSFVTAYEPYKESISTFYLNSPLFKWDKIENINGQITHIKNTQEVLLTGEENWYFVKEDLENGFTMFGTDIETKAPNALYNILSDKLITNVSDESGKEFLRIGNYGNSIFINVSSSALSTVDNNGFKNWLKANPIKALYKTLNPEYEKIEVDLSAELFEGTTHISNNSNIPANMEVTIDRTLNRAVEYTTLAKKNPTIGNLSMARYWTNLAKESIKKDAIQNEINNITYIEDLQLEKKSITSNVDIYIKSENVISMSLDTNSVAFENYSGVEDIIKEGAVNITINSSLPYSLNAYLPSEIQNNDKSNTMDLSILNIKDSSESIYQAFTDNTDKLILKDNCTKGNNMNHSINLKLNGSLAHKSDVYKTVIKFEAEQK